MSKVLSAALILGWVLAAAPVQAQGTTSSTSTSSNSNSWTDVGGVTMKGRVGELAADFDSIMVSEIGFSYEDTSSYRVGSVRIYYGPSPRSFPPQFIVFDAGRKNPRSIRLKKPVLAARIEFNYSNLFLVDGQDARILVR